MAMTMQHLILLYEPVVISLLLWNQKWRNAVRNMNRKK